MSTTLHDFAITHLEPHAAVLDQDASALRATWDRFVDQGLHTRLTLFDALPVLAEYSGAFAFLALQQCVASCPEQPAGVAFGHLRNPTTPAPVWSAGHVSGQVPWFTGAGLFSQALLGFRLTDGSEVRAWVATEDRPAFRHSPPLPLIALQSTQTVSVTLTELPLAESDFLTVAPAGTQAHNDANSVLGQTPLFLGNLRASLRLIADAGRGGLIPAKAAVADLEAAIAAARSSGDAAHDGTALRIRAGALSVQLARLACMAQGGSSLLTGHPGERLYREALLYNLMAQTDALVQASFEALA